MGETLLSMVRALRNQTSLRVLSPFGTFCTVHVPDEVPFDPVGKPGPIASPRAKRPAQYSIYEYVHRGTPVYVGQTKHTLRKRDQQHRQGGKTYFDRQLKMVMRQQAHIRLICKKSFTCPREGKAWMDIMEYLYIRERKTMRGESSTGCNTNRPRHFRETEERIVAAALQDMESLLKHMNLR